MVPVWAWSAWELVAASFVLLPIRKNQATAPIITIRTITPTTINIILIFLMPLPGPLEKPELVDAGGDAKGVGSGWEADVTGSGIGAAWPAKFGPGGTGGGRGEDASMAGAAGELAGGFWVIRLPVPFSAAGSGMEKGNGDIGGRELSSGGRVGADGSGEDGGIG